MTQEIATQRGGGLVKKVLAASLLTVAVTLPALVPAASAEDVVKRGRTIEAFTGTNLVDLQGYPSNKSVRIQVLRNGVLVSSVAGRTDADGFVEFNHTGGGQVPQGDCFQRPVTPDVMPGDMIRTKVAGETTTDRAVVRDIFMDTEATAVSEANDTITVKGHVRNTADAPIARGDVLELRLNADGFTWDVTKDPEDPADEGRRDLRDQVSAAEIRADGSFTHVFRVSDADARRAAPNNFEQAFEWSKGVGEAPPSIFVSDAAGGEPIVGCPPLATHAVTGKSVAAINKANLAQGLRFSGIAKGADAVTVTLSDGKAATKDVKLDATPKRAYTAPGETAAHQTWRTADMTANQLRLLKRLDDGTLTASIGQGPNLDVLKDTVAPSKAPTATPRPGTYSRTQIVTLDAGRGMEIRYTLNGSRPTANSNLFTRPIKVTRTKTIRAIAVDRAGNKSPIGSYRYVIR